MSKKYPHLYGLLAEFGGPERLRVAARAARRAGYKRMDAYTPFPVHGLSKALGMRETRLPVIVLIGGIIGCVGGFLLQWYPSVLGYPVNVGGKPFNSWPAFVIISFELTILAAGFAAVLGMLALNGLPRLHHPLFNSPDFELASRTHFFLCIESRDALFDAVKTREFLESVGATSVQAVPAGKVVEGESPAIPPPPEQSTRGRTSVSLLLVSLLIGALGCDNVNWGMDDEGRLKPMEPSPFFDHQQSARPLVEGTVPRGEARIDEHRYTGRIDGELADTYPFPITRAVLMRGREQFEVFCAVCHNSTGDGQGMIVQRGFVPPPSYHIDRLREAPPGHFFDVITNGWGSMYSYDDRVKVDDRWAIAAYIRALQLSQRAPLDTLEEIDVKQLREAGQ